MTTEYPPIPTGGGTYYLVGGNWVPGVQGTGGVWRPPTTIQAGFETKEGEIPKEKRVLLSNIPKPTGTSLAPRSYNRYTGKWEEMEYRKDLTGGGKAWQPRTKTHKYQEIVPLKELTRPQPTAKDVVLYSNEAGKVTGWQNPYSQQQITFNKPIEEDVARKIVEKEIKGEQTKQFLIKTFNPTIPEVKEKFMEKVEQAKLKTPIPSRTFKGQETATREEVTTIPNFTTKILPYTFAGIPFGKPVELDIYKSQKEAFKKIKTITPEQIEAEKLGSKLIKERPFYSSLALSLSPRYWETLVGFLYKKPGVVEEEIGRFVTETEKRKAEVGVGRTIAETYLKAPAISQILLPYTAGAVLGGIGYGISRFAPSLTTPYHIGLGLAFAPGMAYEGLRIATAPTKEQRIGGALGFGVSLGAGIDGFKIAKNIFGKPIKITEKSPIGYEAIMEKGQRRFTVYGKGIFGNKEVFTSTEPIRYTKFYKEPPSYEIPTRAKVDIITADLSKIGKRQIFILKGTETPFFDITKPSEFIPKKPIWAKTIFNKYSKPSGAKYYIPTISAKKGEIIAPEIAKIIKVPKDIGEIEYIPKLAEAKGTYPAKPEYLAIEELKYTRAKEIKPKLQKLLLQQPEKPPSLADIGIKVSPKKTFMQELGLKELEPIKTVIGRKKGLFFDKKFLVEVGRRGLNIEIKKPIETKTYLEKIYPSEKLSEIKWKGKPIEQMKLKSLKDIEAVRWLIRKRMAKKFPATPEEVEWLSKQLKMNPKEIEARLKNAKLSALEPQVSKAIIQLQEKGYKTISSGFTPKSTKQHIVMEGEITPDLKVIAKKLGIEITEEMGNIKLNIEQKGKTLREVKNKFDLFSEMIPNKKQSIYADVGAIITEGEKGTKMKMLRRYSPIEQEIIQYPPTGEGTPVVRGIKQVFTTTKRIVEPPKVGFIPLITTKQIGGTKVKSNITNKFDFPTVNKLEPIKKQEIIQEEKLIPMNFITPTSLITPKQNKITMVTPQLKIITETIHEPKQPVPTKPVITKEIITEIKPPIPIVVGLPSGKRRIIKKRKVRAYQTYIKERGKYKRFGNPTRIKEALDLGSEYVDKTPSARFKIKPTTKKPVKNPEVKVGYFNMNKRKFRPYKKYKGRKVKMTREFIERKRYRIDKTGEKKGITAKGTQAVRLRKLKRLFR